ncbi:hypothetical protein LARV_00294 [Longilinea arvoryzae]|uniref:Uncharacterized protein n=1 Tax=Longilinea arvoryzae TaxID=360412 RepID=A0A0S7B6K6_9CHLR|nr:hypothetical protein [Longilinea arvoryzae]GAP12558.1 hypothetical protein LARV_00294 [Longilinea arvoryzae]
MLSQSLIPSELVYFNAEKFASTRGVFNKVSLQHTTLQVNRIELVQYLLAAAFLANEKAGLLCLGLRKKKTFFGLSSHMALYADPSGQPSSWEGPCLEADLLDAAEHSANSEVASIVSAWLGRNYSEPYDEVLERSKANLAERGLLDMQEERRLKIFVSHSYSLPEECRAFIAAQPLDPLNDLLQACQTSRPQVWQALLRDAKSAVDSRQEQMDVDG